MLLQVQPSDRYEGPRAPYAAAKRPLTVPSGRSVNPRLEQETPTDPVKGLGRRKIPTSSQHPTRSTNVPIVYSRLSAPRSLGQRALHNGDVMFVGKNDTAFGAGTNRFSRCATLDDINGMLELDSNLLFDTDVKQARKLLDSRSRINSYLRESVSHQVSEQRSMRKAKQLVSNDMDEGLQRLLDGNANVDMALLEADANVAANQATPVWPEFDWMALPALQNWNMDGVLLGSKVDDSILNHVIPNPADGDRLLNVCVEGPCPLRNQASVVPQFFDDGVEPGGFLYVCLVAFSEHGADWWQFKLKTVSSRQLSCLHVTKPMHHAAPAPSGGLLSKFTVGDLINTVAVWKLGRVVDDKLGTGQHGKVLLDVDIVLMDRIGFLRHLFGDDSDSELGDMIFKRIVRPPPPPPPPQPVPPMPVLPGGQPNPAGPGGQQGPNAGNGNPGPANVNPGPNVQPPPGVVIVPVNPEEDSDDDNEPEPPGQLEPPERGLVVYRPMLFLPPPGQNLFVAADRALAPYEDVAFNFGRAARIAGTQGWFKAFDQQVYPLTPNWLERPHHRFPEVNNGAVVVSTQTYTLRMLASKPQPYQSQWICNAVYMTEAGLPRAIDQFMLSAGPSIVDYNDICWLFSLMKDGGLTHALCNALKNAKLAGQRLFPYEIKTSRVNEAARVGMISFQLPPVKDGKLQLEGLLDMSRFVAMAPGTSFTQRARRVSFSLNLLFDLPMNTEWGLSDTGSCNRSVADRDIWTVGSDARLGYLTDLSQNALTTGNDFQSTNFLTQLVCFGLLNATAMSSSTFKAIQTETARIPGSAFNAAVQPNASALSVVQGSAYGSGILESLAGASLTPAAMDDPYTLAPANFSGSTASVPVPQRAPGAPSFNKQQLDALATQRPDLFVFAAGRNTTAGDAVAAGVWSFSRMVYDGAVRAGSVAGNLMWDFAQLGADQYDPFGAGLGPNRRPLA